MYMYASSEVCVPIPICMHVWGGGGIGTHTSELAPSISQKHSYSVSKMTCILRQKSPVFVVKRALHVIKEALHSTRRAPLFLTPPALPKELYMLKKSPDFYSKSPVFSAKRALHVLLKEGRFNIVYISVFACVGMYVCVGGEGGSNDALRNV